jgi:hypothetical protein
LKVKVKKYPCYRPWRPIGLREVKAPHLWLETSARTERETYKSEIYRERTRKKKNRQRIVVEVNRTRRKKFQERIT